MANQFTWARLGLVLRKKLLRILMDKFEKLKTDIAPFKSRSWKRVTWLEPKLVCEVGYQVVTRDVQVKNATFQRV